MDWINRTSMLGKIVYGDPSGKDDDPAYEGLNDNQKTIMRRARYADAYGRDTGRFTAHEMQVREALTAKQQAEADALLRQAAVGVTLTPEQIDTVAKSGRTVPPQFLGPQASPGVVLNPAQETLIGAIKNYAAPTSQYTPTRPDADTLRLLAAQGIDTTGIAPEGEFQTIYDADTGREQRAWVNKNAPSEVVTVGGVKAKDPTKFQATTIYNNGRAQTGVFNLETGQLEGTLGGLKGDDPTEFDLKTRWFMSQGMDPERARGYATGGIKVINDPSVGPMEVNYATGESRPLGAAPATTGPTPGVVPPRLARERAAENDRLMQAISQIDSMLGGEAFQEGVGIKSAAGRAYNRAVRPIFGGEGFPESDQVKLEADSLIQTVVGLYQAGDKRINEGDFLRLKDLLPNGGVFQDTVAARQRLMQARKIFEDILQRPLPTDPRFSPPPQGSADPLALSPSTAPANDPLGLFQ